MAFINLKKIIELLEHDSFNVPAKHKIEHVLKVLKKRQYEETINLASLEKLCYEHSFMNK